MNSMQKKPLFCWLNGTIREESAALLPATSAGTLLGWGVFTTIGIFAGKPFSTELHLARLRHDAEKVQVAFPYSDHEIVEALTEILTRNAVNEGLARLTLLRSGDGRWNTEVGNHFLLTARENSATTHRRNKNECRVMLSPHHVNERRATSGLKTTSYLDALMAWQEAQVAGFDEALLLNTQKKICEGGRSNVFWERGNEVFTASEDCGPLPGIGRALLLQWLRESGVACHEGVFSLEELTDADGMWLISSATGVRPIRELHDLSGEYSSEKSTLLKIFETESKIIAMLKSKWYDATHGL